MSTISLPPQVAEGRDLVDALQGEDHGNDLACLALFGPHYDLAALDPANERAKYPSDASVHCEPLDALRNAIPVLKAQHEHPFEKLFRVICVGSTT